MGLAVVFGKTEDPKENTPTRIFLFAFFRPPSWFKAR